MKQLIEIYKSCIINQDDINNYFEAVNRRKEIKLENIDSIIKRESKKHGKKSIEYQVIQELKNEKLNDIAIYVGIALSKIMQKPKWNVEDITNLFNSKQFISKKFIPILDKVIKKKVSEEELKKIALEIKNDILNNEKETLDQIRNTLNSMSTKKKITLAHELKKDDIIKIKNVIIDTINILSKLMPDDFKIENILNYSTNSSQPIYNFINQLVLGGQTSLLNEIEIAITELNNLINTNPEYKNKLIKYIIRLKNNKAQLERIHSLNILWPELDVNINSINDLEKYFNKIESDRERGQKVINTYKMKIKKPKTVDKIEEEFTYKTFKQFLRKIAKQFVHDNDVKIFDGKELTQALDKVSEKILKEMKNVKQFLKQDSYDPQSELTGLLAKEIKSGNFERGRPTKE